MTDPEKQEWHARLHEIISRQTSLKGAVDAGFSAPHGLAKAVWFDLNWLLNQVDKLQRIREELDRR